MREFIGLIALGLSVYFIVQIIRKRKNKGTSLKFFAAFIVALIVVGWGFYDNRPTYSGVKVTESQQKQLDKLSDAESKVVWQYAKKTFDASAISERAYHIRAPYLKLNGKSDTNVRLIDGWVSDIKNAAEENQRSYGQYLAYHAIQKLNRKTANHVTKNNSDSNTVYKQLEKSSGLTK